MFLATTPNKPIVQELLNLPLPLIILDVILIAIIALYVWRGTKGGVKTTYFAFGKIMLVTVFLMVGKKQIEALQLKDKVTGLLGDTASFAPINLVETYFNGLAAIVLVVVGWVISSILLWLAYAIILKFPIKSINNSFSAAHKKIIGALSGLVLGVYTVILATTLFYAPVWVNYHANFKGSILLNTTETMTGNATTVKRMPALEDLIRIANNAIKYGNEGFDGPKGMHVINDILTSEKLDEYLPSIIDSFYPTDGNGPINLPTLEEAEYNNILQILNGDLDPNVVYPSTDGSNTEYDYNKLKATKFTTEEKEKMACQITGMPTSKGCDKFKPAA